MPSCCGSLAPFPLQSNDRLVSIHHCLCGMAWDETRSVVYLAELNLDNIYVPVTDSQPLGELCLTVISLSTFCSFVHLFLLLLFVFFLNVHIPVICPKSCSVISGSQQQLPVSLCANLYGFPWAFVSGRYNTQCSVLTLA